MYKKENEINEFMARISKFEATEQLPSENPYAHTDSIQYYNLKNYLLHMAHCEPKIMLIGEAPGYRGCGITGIPFTSDVELNNTENDFAIGNWQRKNNTKVSETTARCVWSTIREKYGNDGTIPIMWNIFPFHPYRVGNNNTNRTPSEQEMEIGKQFVEMLIEIYAINEENIYAVGRRAQSALNLPDEHYIRHPSHGGTNKFHDYFVSHNF